MERKLKNIYYLNEDSNYGLKILFDLNNILLLFDSISFVYISNDQLSNFKHWKTLNYLDLSKESIDIKIIKEDELTSYFVELTNQDILYIFQIIDGLEQWSQSFKIISKNDNEYDKIIQYMNEEWIEIVSPKEG